jgi:hypothetical protein
MELPQYAWLLLLFFASVGLKLLLGMAAIYLLLPRDRRCMVCDGETLPLLLARGWRLLARACRVQRRWCPVCDEIQLARYRPEPQVPAAPPTRPAPARPVGSS